jgi:hypothetical protein
MSRPKMPDSTDLTSPRIVLARQRPRDAIWFQRDQNNLGLVVALYTVGVPSYRDCKEEKAASDDV